MVDLSSYADACIGDRRGVADGGSRSLVGWDLIVPSRPCRRSSCVILVSPWAPLAKRCWRAAGRRASGRQYRCTTSARTSKASSALGREAQWLTEARPILEWVGGAEHALACVKAPAAEQRRLSAVQRTTLAAIRSSGAARKGRSRSWTRPGGALASRRSPVRPLIPRA